MKIASLNPHALMFSKSKERKRKRKLTAERNEKDYFTLSLHSGVLQTPFKVHFMYLSYYILP